MLKASDHTSTFTSAVFYVEDSTQTIFYFSFEVKTQSSDGNQSAVSPELETLWVKEDKCYIFMEQDL